MTDTIHFHILFDGGSLNNGAANQSAYGSALIVDRHGKKRLIRREFGHSTSNQAEYKALISALQHLLTKIADAGHKPHEFNIRIVGDSQLVLNQVAGTFKVKSPNLRTLHTLATTLVKPFNHVTFQHTPRETCLRLLGH
jgi:ribonuclease HI